MTRGWKRKRKRRRRKTSLRVEWNRETKFTSFAVKLMNGLENNEDEERVVDNVEKP